MRILYKALASAGMVLLSTAVAFGIRHFRLARKQADAAKDAVPRDPTPETQEIVQDEGVEVPQTEDSVEEPETEADAGESGAEEAEAEEEH